MYEIKISGMTCNGCLNGLTNALKKLDSNADIQIELSSQMLRIQSQKSKEEISSTIDNAGFEVKEIKII
jgi:copper chaperone